MAHAKVNLSLEVLGSRPDGFHNLVSVMQEVSLHDTLQGMHSDRVAVQVEGAALGMDNLVVRAAGRFRERLGIREGCHITVHKRIPVAAGLGGGSSDAAATLRLLDHLWNTRAESRVLANMAADLGSDVPFFLTGGTAAVSGRGESVEPLPATQPTWYVLTNPGFEVSTAEVFAALTPDRWSDGARTREIASMVRKEARVRIGVNALQPVLFELYPAAHLCFERAEALAPGKTIITGSGPTVLSLLGSRSDAERAAGSLRQFGYWTAAVHSINRKGDTCL